MLNKKFKPTTEVKNHYRMYKSGKQWLFQRIAVAGALTILGGVGIAMSNQTQASADTVQTVSTPTSSTQQSSTSTTTNTPASAVTNSVATSTPATSAEANSVSASSATVNSTVASGATVNSATTNPVATSGVDVNSGADNTISNRLSSTADSSSSTGSSSASDSSNQYLPSADQIAYTHSLPVSVKPAPTGQWSNLNPGYYGNFTFSMDKSGKAYLTGNGTYVHNINFQNYTSYSIIQDAVNTLKSTDKENTDYLNKTDFDKVTDLTIAGNINLDNQASIDTNVVNLALKGNVNFVSEQPSTIDGSGDLLQDAYMQMPLQNHNFNNLDLSGLNTKAIYNYNKSLNPLPMMNFLNGVSFKTLTLGANTLLAASASDGTSSAGLDTTKTYVDSNGNIASGTTLQDGQSHVGTWQVNDGSSILPTANNIAYQTNLSKKDDGTNSAYFTGNLIYTLDKSGNAYVTGNGSYVPNTTLIGDIQSEHTKESANFNPTSLTFSGGVEAQNSFTISNSSSLTKLAGLSSIMLNGSRANGILGTMGVTTVNGTSTQSPLTLDFTGANFNTTQAPYTSNSGFPNTSYGTPLFNLTNTPNLSSLNISEIKLDNTPLPYGSFSTNGAGLYKNEKGQYATLTTLSNGQAHPGDWKLDTTDVAYQTIIPLSQVAYNGMTGQTNSGVVSTNNNANHNSDIQYILTTDGTLLLSGNNLSVDGTQTNLWSMTSNALGHTGVPVKNVDLSGLNMVITNGITSNGWYGAKTSFFNLDKIITDTSQSGYVTGFNNITFNNVSDYSNLFNFKNIKWLNLGNANWGQLKGSNMLPGGYNNGFNELTLSNNISFQETTPSTSTSLTNLYGGLNYHGSNFQIVGFKDNDLNIYSNAKILMDGNNHPGNWTLNKDYMLQGSLPTQNGSGKTGYINYYLDDNGGVHFQNYDTTSIARNITGSNAYLYNAYFSASSDNTGDIILQNIQKWTNNSVSPTSIIFDNDISSLDGTSVFNGANSYNSVKSIIGLNHLKFIPLGTGLSPDNIAWSNAYNSSSNLPLPSTMLAPFTEVKTLDLSGWDWLSYSGLQNNWTMQAGVGGLFPNSDVLTMLILPKETHIKANTYNYNNVTTVGGLKEQSWINLQNLNVQNKTEGIFNLSDQGGFWMNDNSTITKGIIEQLSYLTDTQKQDVLKSLPTLTSSSDFDNYAQQALVAIVNERINSAKNAQAQANAQAKTDAINSAQAQAQTDKANALTSQAAELAQDKATAVAQAVQAQAQSDAVDKANALEIQANSLAQDKANAIQAQVAQDKTDAIKQVQAQSDLDATAKTNVINSLTAEYDKQLKTANDKYNSMVAQNAIDKANALANAQTQAQADKANALASQASELAKDKADLLSSAQAQAETNKANALSSAQANASSEKASAVASQAQADKALLEQALANAKAQSDKVLSDAKTQSEQDLANAKAQADKQLSDEKAKSEQALASAKAQSDKALVDAKAQADKAVADAESKSKTVTVTDENGKQEVEKQLAKTKAELKKAQDKARKGYIKVNNKWLNFKSLKKNVAVLRKIRANNIQTRFPSMKVIKAVNAGKGATKFTLLIEGKVLTITLKNSTLVPTYYANRHSYFFVKTKHTIRVHKHMDFNKGKAVKEIKRGSTVKVVGIKKFQGITRLVLEDGSFITSNKYWVKML